MQKIFTAFLFLPLLSLLFACRPASRDLGPPPNVLLLVVDCLRADHVSAHGYERPTTPSIDQLAGGGILFGHAISQASWTRPSLPTLLTGLYPSEHGLHAFYDEGGGEVKSPRLADSVVTLAEALGKRGYATALIGEQFQLAPRFGLDQGFEVFENRANVASSIHRRFLSWLDHETAERPFFAYLHYLEIHWPYCPPRAIRGTFDAGRSSIRWCRDWRQLREDILSGAVELGEDDRQAMEARYDEELLALDEQLGKLFAALRERQLWDDTVIVLTSDHGEEFFEHGAITHGQSLYEELIHVPLVVKPPAAWKVAPGKRSEGVVELRQVAPTLVEAAGAEPLPGSSAPSLVPAIFGGEEWAAQMPFGVAESHDEVALRTTDLKLIVDRAGRSFELYDLRADPRETTNVALERRSDLLRLRRHLETWEKSLRPAAQAEVEALDQETLEGLRALGYIE